jgi:putative type II/III system pilus formation protein
MRAARLYLSLATAAMMLILSAPGWAQTVEINPGRARLITFSVPIRTVVIGDPTVADVAAQTDRSIIINGIAVGETNLVVLNEEGREVYSADVVVSGVAGGGRVVFHTKPGSLQEYWTYQCTQYGCRRRDDRFEGPPTSYLINPSIQVGAPQAPLQQQQQPQLQPQPQPQPQLLPQPRQPPRPVVR